MATNQRFVHDRLRLRWIGLSLVLGLLVLPVMATSAQEQIAVVRSDPGVIELPPGQTVTVNVVLAEAHEVYAIDVRAAFDPQLVEVVDADPAREGVQFSPGTFPRADFLVRNVADNQAGTLHYAITQVNPTEPVDGDGVAFSVQLRAKAASGEGTFTISAVELTDRDGVLLAVQPESSLIRVIPSGQVEPTAAPVAPTATSPATAIPPPSSPTVPPPAPATQAAPAVPAAAPTLSSSPEPAVAAPPADTPASALLAPESASAPADSSSSGAAEPAAATPQAVAAAETPVSAAPAIAPAAAPPDAPVNSGAVAQADTDAQRVAPAQNAPSTLPRRQPRAEDANAERATPVDPSKVLLIVGAVALAVAVVTALLMVVILRR